MTTKFLKLGLLTTLSIIPISALTISCKEEKKENANNNNNNNNTQNPETPNNAEIAKKLEEAKGKFSITTKEEFDYSTVRADEIKKDNIEQYFTLSGKLTGFTYTLSKLETIGEHELGVTYKIELSGQSVDRSFTFNGFKGLNLIDDYNYNDPNHFFAIALNKEHLNTIAFAAQQYTVESLVKQGWTLNFEDKSGYTLTKTNKYLMIEGKKFNVHTIKFTNPTPITQPFQGGPDHHAPFTEKGKEYHDKNNGFQIAIEDGVNEIV